MNNKGGYFLEQNGTYRAIAEILYFANEHHRLANQPGDVGRDGCVEIGTGAWRWPFLQEVCQEVSRTVSDQSWNWHKKKQLAMDQGNTINHRLFLSTLPSSAGIIEVQVSNFLLFREGEKGAELKQSL